MQTVLIAYSTKQGHSEKIARNLAEHLADNGYTVEVGDLAKADPNPAGRDAVLLIAKVHMGAHAAEARQWVLNHLNALHRTRSGFLSVSISATGDADARDEARRNTEKFLETTLWSPTSTSIVAGELPHREFGPIKRWFLRRVAMAVGVPAPDHASDSHGYTDWFELDVFADTLVGDVDDGVVRRPRSFSTGV